MNKQRVIVAYSGASGADYPIRILELLGVMGVETHFVASRSALVSMAHESPYKLSDFKALASFVHSNEDIAAPIASGSFQTLGMVVAPCSVKSLAEIAVGLGASLIPRAADVVLKERRRLVLMVRESPLHLIHCRNMVSVTEAGAVVMPPVPAFYPRPETIAEIVDHSAARALDLLGLPPEGVKRWKDHD